MGQAHAIPQDMRPEHCPRRRRRLRTWHRQRNQYNTMMGQSTPRSSRRDRDMKCNESPETLIGVQWVWPP